MIHSCIHHHLPFTSECFQPLIYSHVSCAGSGKLHLPKALNIKPVSKNLGATSLVCSVDLVSPVNIFWKPPLQAMASPMRPITKPTYEVHQASKHPIPAHIPNEPNTDPRKVPVQVLNWPYWTMITPGAGLTIISIFIGPNPFNTIKPTKINFL